MGIPRKSLVIFAAAVWAYYLRLPYYGPEVTDESFGSHPRLSNQPGGDPGTVPVLNFATKVGWAEGQTPQAPDGFSVSLFGKTEHGRWLLVLPNGDVLVAEAKIIIPKEDEPLEDRIGSYFFGKADNAGESPNRITLLRDTDGDGKAEYRSIFIKDLTQPLGMALHNGFLYVGCTNSVLQFPYTSGVTEIPRSAGVVIARLPKGGYNHHWTRNVFIHNDKLYVTVGSAANVAEHGIEEEFQRACVLEMNLDGSNRRIFANGIRNPVGSLKWSSRLLCVVVRFLLVAKYFWFFV